MIKSYAGRSRDRTFRGRWRDASIPKFCFNEYTAFSAFEAGPAASAISDTANITTTLADCELNPQTNS